MKRAYNSVDLTGRYFGLLKVLFYHDTVRPFKTARARWFCECTCGNFKVVTGDKLKTGRIKSCGCLLFKHNMTGTKLYNTWKNIKGREIGICEEWKDFEKFYEWSIQNGYTEDLYLSRFDRNIIYSPENCSWTTKYRNGPAPILKEGDTIPTYVCSGCGEPLTRWNQKYCSSKCQKDSNYRKQIKLWKGGEHDGLSGSYQTAKFIRKYLVEKYKGACALCGWSKVNTFSGRVPLEVEHIDGNYKNNVENNLILICPNCHSLTATFRGLNRGKGRKERSKHNLPSSNKVKVQKVVKLKCPACGVIFDKERRHTHLSTGGETTSCSKKCAAEWLHLRKNKEMADVIIKSNVIEEYQKVI